jgi:hypothetical protein
MRLRVVDEEGADPLIERAAADGEEGRRVRIDGDQSSVA